jgi:hypothetical protein
MPENSVMVGALTVMVTGISGYAGRGPIVTATSKLLRAALPADILPIVDVPATPTRPE